MKKPPTKDEVKQDPVLEAEANPHPPGSMAYQLWEA